MKVVDAEETYAYMVLPNMPRNDAARQLGVRPYSDHKSYLGT